MTIAFRSRPSFVSRSFFMASAFLASVVISLTTGCASGGFKLTRQYATFVNSQNIVIRILLYIFTSIVFAATLLIDMVINNTMDFWSGRVSSGTYNFKSGDKTYTAKHEILETNLKRSTIETHDLQGHLLETVRIEETKTKNIEVYVNDVLRTRVSNINEVPVATTFDKNGFMSQANILVSSERLATVQ